METFLTASKTALVSNDTIFNIIFYYLKKYLRKINTNIQYIIYIFFLREDHYINRYNRKTFIYSQVIANLWWHK